MRNLKRALSLALASVMLLGMMVVGTSAASYPDVDSNDNTEAIEVLNAVGAMIGDDNGNFNPDKNVTRNEMAAVVARLLLGAEAENYIGTHPFTDVPSWAQKYVAACYDAKIVTGRSATVYDGNSTVNAQEAATMMLRALGYEGLAGTGADWARSVVAKANQIRLFRGITSSATAPMSRNQIAQLTLNTLESTMVDAQDNTIHIGTGADAGNISITGGQINYIVRSSGDSKVSTAISSTEDSGNSASGINGWTLELGEQLYNGQLKKRTNQTDNMGRPATTWVYKNSTIGTYSTEADHTVYVPYASTAKTVTKMIEDIDKSYKIVSATKILVNGDTDNLKAASYTPAVGDRLEVFMDSTVPGNVKTIAITHWRVDKMTGNTATRVDSKDTLVRLPGVRGLSTFNSDNTTETVHGYEGLVENDIVLVYQDGEGEYWVEKAESFTGTVTAVEGVAGRDRATIDGQKYEKSGATNTLNNGGDSPITFNKNEATWYLDKGGNIVWVVGKEVTEVAYVVDFGATTPIYSSGTDYYAKLLTNDGTVISVITKKDYRSGTTNPAKAAFSVGEVVKYEKDGEKYVLSHIATTTKEDTVSEKNTPAGSGGTPAAVTTLNAAVIQKNNPNITTGGAKNIATNSETIFMVRQYDGVNPTDTFTLYTGYTNAPSLKGASSDFGTTAYLSAYIGSNGYAKYVYVDAGKAVAATSDDLIYVISASKTEIPKSDGGSYYSVKGVKKGGSAIEDIFFATDPTTIAADTAYIVDTYNSDGQISTYHAVTHGGKYVIGTGTGDTVGTSISLGIGTYRDDSVEVWLINEKGDKAEVGGASLIEKDNNDKFVLVLDTTGTGTATDVAAKVVFIREVKDGAGQLPAGSGKSAIESMLSSEGTATVTNANTAGGISVGAGETLNLDGNTTGGGTITTTATSKVVLKNMTTMPTITGNGTVEVNCDLSEDNTAYNAIKTAGTVATGDKDAPKNVNIASLLKFTGSGEIPGFGGESASSIAGAGNTVSVVRFVIPSSTAGGTLTGKMYHGDNDETGVDMVLGPNESGSATIAASQEEGIPSAVASDVTKVEFIVTPVGGTAETYTWNLTR